MKLKDKTVVVSGGARGIGKALCKTYSNEGARVVVADQQANETATAAVEIGGFCVGCDVSFEADIQKLD